MVEITDNVLVRMAVNELYLQVLKQFPYSPDEKNIYNKFCADIMSVYDNNSPLRIHKIESGPDAGKLTLEERAEDGKYNVNNGIKPVDCYNLIGPKEDIAVVISRLDIEKYGKPHVSRIILPSENCPCPILWLYYDDDIFDDII